MSYVLFNGYFQQGKHAQKPKGDVTRDDLQRRFLAQHSLTTLFLRGFEWLQSCSNIWTLCCVKNRRCELSRVTSPQFNINALPKILSVAQANTRHTTSSIAVLVFRFHPCAQFYSSASYPLMAKCFNGVFSASQPQEIYVNCRTAYAKSWSLNSPFNQLFNRTLNLPSNRLLISPFYHAQRAVQQAAQLG